MTEEYQNPPKNRIEQRSSLKGFSFRDYSIKVKIAKDMFEEPTMDIQRELFGTREYIGGKRL